MATTSGSTLLTYLGSLLGIGGVNRSLHDKLAERISVHDFGAKGDKTTDDSVAFQAALDYAEQIGATEVYCPNQYYVLTVGLKIPNGVTLVGRGIDSWDTVFPNRIKGWRGTNLLFKGTGAKNESFYGVTDRKVSGGYRPDTDGSGRVYKLTSFTNNDANGATRATARLFSAAISPKQRDVSSNDSHAFHWGMKNLRIVPWMGSDGTSGYSDKTNTSLGDNWDVGLYVINSEYEHFENVQVVGYWRIAGTLKVQPGYSEWGAGERGSYVRFKTQGYRGLVLRGSDNTFVTAATSNTVQIPYTDNHFWNTSGSFEIPGGTDFTYTGLTFADDKLTFTGVTPDASAINGNIIRPVRRGTGIAGSIFQNVIVTGLSHVSGQSSVALGFPEYSIGFEISGFPLRGYEFIDFKVQNSAAEPCNTFIGDCDDVLMFGCQFENGKVVATPYRTDQTWATYPVGNTTDLRMYGMVWSADKTLFTPRTYFDDGEVFGPLNSTSNTEDITATQAGKTKIFQKQTGQRMVIQDGDGTDLAEFSATAGTFILKNGRQLSLSGSSGLINVDTSQNLSFRNGTTTRLTMFGGTGNWAPGVDNSHSWGTSTARWSKGHFVNLGVYPPASVTPSTNGEMTFELTSDTQLKVKVKGNDGIVRSGTITLS